MSILIRGMEMPKCCGICSYNKSSCYCGITKSEIDRDYEYAERLADCPLVNVPPHGRLIDADALNEAMARMVPWAIADPTANAFLDGLSAAYEVIQSAPTIIPAEEE